jgi:hypothetical protein
MEAKVTKEGPTGGISRRLAGVNGTIAQQLADAGPLHLPHLFAVSSHSSLRQGSSIAS